MDPKRTNAAVLILSAVLLVVLLITFVSVQSVKSAQQQGITLPGVQSQQDAVLQPASGAEFAEITPQNVQQVIEKSLARPVFYYQLFTVTLQEGGRSGTQQIELWRQGELLEAVITQNSTARHLLTDGQTLYIWYNGNEAPAMLTPDETITADELLGLPTYESLLALPKANIRAAELITLPEQDDAPCLYVSCLQDGSTQDYWVRLDNGLLCKQVLYSGDDAVYTAEQRVFTLLSTSDESLDDLFMLPDGTKPFATAE